MRKIIFLAVLISLFFVFNLPCKAKIVTLTGKGEVIINVLSSQDSLALGIPKNESISVKEISVGEDTSLESRISLAKSGENYKLSILSSEGDKEFDVTNLKGHLIEIEERPQVKKVKIGLIQGKFFLEEAGILALTEYPINIDPKNAEISVETESGKHFLAVLPFEALQNCLKAKIINNFSNRNLTISEKKPGNISYQIEGEKSLNVFNVFRYNIPVTALVSTLTGEILETNEPIWLKLLGFILG